MKCLPVAVGKLAKTCEALDHLEEHDYLESFSRHVLLICFYMLAAARYGFALNEAHTNRLTEIERKSIETGNPAHLNKCEAIPKSRDFTL